MSVHQPVTIGHYTHCANCLEAWPCDTRQHQQGRQLAWSITALTITLCAIAALTIWSLP